MKKFLSIIAVVSALAAPSVLAEGMPAPGPEFGAHVAAMMPQHAVAHGAAPGAMVSAMATGAPCPAH